MNKIIYVMDPLCGWCYGNSENILKVKRQFSDQFEFEIMAGGMWIPPHTRSGGSELSEFMKQHGPPMVKTTGAIISDSFYELANNPNYTFSSLEACAAQVLVKELKPYVTFEFASAVQKAFYQTGTPLNELNTYTPILKELGVDASVFESKWMQHDNMNATKAEFQKAGSLAQGFPTLLIEIKGEIAPITSGYFQLKPMVEHLNKLATL
jgi:putative protein-disulfide isomerase